VPPITLGRVPPNDLVLKDSEVSGKHARINWNAKVSFQELFVVHCAFDLCYLTVCSSRLVAHCL
jgi:hypothetical protein